MLQIGRLYYKGITSSRTQATTRTATDNIAQAIQFSGTVPRATAVAAGPPIDLTNAGSGAVCIGNQRFSYFVNRVVSDSPNAALSEARHALVADVAPANGSCTSALTGAGELVTGAGAPVNPKELIAAGMRLSEFKILQTDVGYDISIAVTAGAIDLSNPNGTCRSGNGNQFCSYSQLKTVAKRRL